MDGEDTKFKCVIEAFATLAEVQLLKLDESMRRSVNDALECMKK